MCTSAGFLLRQSGRDCNRGRRTRQVSSQARPERVSHQGSRNAQVANLLLWGLLEPIRAYPAMSRLASSTTSSSTAASKPQRPRMYSEAREERSDTEPKSRSRLASPELACARAGASHRRRGCRRHLDLRQRLWLRLPPALLLAHLPAIRMCAPARSPHAGGCGTVSPRPCMYRSGRSSENESASVSTLSSSVAPSG